MLWHGLCVSVLMSSSATSTAVAAAPAGCWSIANQVVYCTLYIVFGHLQAKQERHQTRAGQVATASKPQSQAEPKRNRCPDEERSTASETARVPATATGRHKTHLRSLGHCKSVLFDSHDLKRPHAAAAGVVDLLAHWQMGRFKALNLSPRPQSPIREKRHLNHVVRLQMTGTCSDCNKCPPLCSSVTRAHVPTEHIGLAGYRHLQVAVLHH